MHKKNIKTIDSLSPAQQGMFYETVSAPGTGMFIEQLVCTLTGRLDVCSFERAWQQEIERHESLRTCFVWEKQPEPLQVVLYDVEIMLQVHDWSDLSTSEQAICIDTYLKEDRKRGFKLSQAPLMRLALFQLGKGVYRFVWTHHHILMDGWCLPLIVKEVFVCYEALSNGRNFQFKPSRPYRDYMAWLKRQDLSTAEAFWRRVLKGFAKPTPLGREGVLLDMLWPAERYGSARLLLSLAQTTHLQSVARQHRVTLNTLLQGTWALLLSRYSNTDDVVFGITVAGRPSTLAGVETIVGPCLNTLPVRVKIAPDAHVGSWLSDIQAYNLELRQYEYSPAERIHQWSELPGASSLYESLLVVENYPVDLSILKSPTLHIAVSNMHMKGAQTKSALTFLITIGTELGIECIYDAHCFPRSTIEHLLEHFQMVLVSLAADTEQQLLALQHLIPAHQIPVVNRLDAHREQQHSARAPRNPLEEMLMSAWIEVLGIEHIGIDDNFFSLGGHSLLATQLVSRIRTNLGLNVPLSTLFAAPTVSKLAEQIARMRDLKIGLHTPEIVPVPREGDLCLSFAQQRLWFLNQLMPDSYSYTINRVLRCNGALDIEVLQRSLQEIVNRHEVLRTTFADVRGNAVQVIAPSLLLELPVIDLRGVGETTQKAEISQHIGNSAKRLFDLSKGPLLCVTLLQLSHRDYILLLTIHHIVYDLWSESQFLRELAILYKAFSAGKPSPLAALHLQYADFAAWQRNWLQGEVLDALVAYWQKQLLGATPLELPTTYPRKSLSNFHGELEFFSLSSDLVAALMALSRQEGVTLFMTLLLAFQVLLHHYTHQDDVVVGTNIANRNRSETERLIGFFVNLLVLRTRFRSKSRFKEMLRSVRATVLDAYAHQDLPFEKLVEALQLERTLNQIPLVRVLFVFQNVPVPSLDMDGLTIQPVEAEVTTTNFDLILFMQERSSGLVGAMNYRTDLFSRADIQKMIQHFLMLIRSIVKNPDELIKDLEIYSEEEKAQKAVQESLEREARRLKLKVARRDVVEASRMGLR